MPQVNSTQLAWAAGLIDGEGCIFISRVKPDNRPKAVNASYRLALKVSMCNEETVRYLHDLFEVGSVSSVKGKRGPRSNPAWAWLVNINDTIKVLRLVYPYLLTKRAEADIAFEFAALPRHSKAWHQGPMPAEAVAARHDCWLRMRALKTTNRAKIDKENAA